MTWDSLIATYLDSLRTTQRAPATLEIAERWLTYFVALCQRHGALEPVATTSHHVEHFRQELLWHVGKHGRLYSQNTVSQALTAVRSLLRWATSRQALMVDPAAALVLPRVKAKPRRPLTVDEMERLLAVPDDTSGEGLRDRAVLETLYGCGIRLNECHLLDLADLDLATGVLHVRGKGGWERYVPVGDALREVLTRYLRDSRPRLLARELRRFSSADAADQRDEAALFLSTHATRFSTQSITKLVQHAARRAGLGLHSPHQLRRAFATHLLEGGADYFSLQMLLGHRFMQSTAIYAQVSARDLQAVHQATHPRARRQPQGRET